MLISFSLSDGGGKVWREAFVCRENFVKDKEILSFGVVEGGREVEFVCS